MVKQNRRIVVFLLVFLLLLSVLGLFESNRGGQAAYASNSSGWTSDCDGYGTPAFVWNGLQLCNGTGRAAETFGPSPTGNFDEFQCTELVGRYLWMQYGFSSLKNSDGANIVDAYSNAHPETLHRFYNDHRVQIMKIAPTIGDVISFSYVHTAIVYKTTVDGSGNGDLTLLEQNYPIGHAGSSRTIHVSSWLIDSGAGVKDWMTTRTSTGYPGGWWTDSVNTANPPSTVTLSFHAAKNYSDGVSYVNFTKYTPSTNAWTVAQKMTATDGSVVSYTLSLTEQTIISADVYSPSGNYQLAPSGVRRLCYQGSCSLIASISYGDTANIGGGSSGTSTGCVPGSNQAALFVDPNFGGPCVIKGIGSYTDSNAIGLPNDSISSVKVGGGANVELCRDAGLSNTCEWFNQDAADLSTHSVGTDQVSSVQVQGGQPTTGCAPTADQVTFFVDPGFSGTCVNRDIGDYLDPGAIGLPNDSISSMRVGSRVKLEVCRDNGLSNTCEWFTSDAQDLSTHSVGTDQISSAHVESRGVVNLCDGQNGGGPCVLFGPGKYNLADFGFRDRGESLVYEPGAGGQFHTVVWSEDNETGNPAHYDNSVGSFDASEANHVRSIEIYKHTPPGTVLLSPANGTVLSSNTTNLNLTYTGGDTHQVHVWGPSYDVESGWISATTFSIGNLSPGTYSWQSQGQNGIGIGAWSDIWSFAINPPPYVVSNGISLQEGTSASVQVQSVDADGKIPALSASGLPAFGTFVDNYDGSGTLSLTPKVGNAGTYNVTVSANDGLSSGSGAITVTVTAATPTPTPTPSPTPAPANGVELLSAPWHLTGNNGAAEADKQIPANSLNGMVSAQVTFDLHGTPFCNGHQCGDDEASIVFIQTDWRAAVVLKTTYGAQNGFNGPQTVTIPLTDFHQVGNSTVKLDPSQPVSNLHARFWNDRAFTVDITSIKLLPSAQTPTPTPTPSPTNTPSPTPSPTPTSGVELLTTPWHLTGSNGASEKYQSISTTVLNGMNYVRITYDLHGLNALGGDASAIIFDQNGWQYISLSDYGHNGLNGSQVVEIPLSAFGTLNLSQPNDGTVHVRFWYGSSFTVDITSIVVFKK